MSNNTSRLFLVGALVVAGGALAAVAFSDMGENLVYYWEPTQLMEAGDKAYGAQIRLAGLVKDGTLDWNEATQTVKLTVVDANEIEVPVIAQGAPPQMLREGIGVVVEGTYTQAGVFEADQLLVKHSNEYKAPEEGATAEEMYKTLEQDFKTN
ncbi:MAG: cytochrome c maturation protein CcmE [Myxococcota bacterium]|nr:cytochrome c maturation protein CcmE [Myxococcota bacterium]